MKYNRETQWVELEFAKIPKFWTFNGFTRLVWAGFLCLVLTWCLAVMYEYFVYLKPCVVSFGHTFLIMFELSETWALDVWRFCSASTLPDFFGMSWYKVAWGSVAWFFLWIYVASTGYEAFVDEEKVLQYYERHKDEIEEI